MRTFVAQPLRSAFALATGFGLRDYLKRHKKAAWVIVALVVANELRGVAVVYAIFVAWGWL